MESFKQKLNTAIVVSVCICAGIFCNAQTMKQLNGRWDFERAELLGKSGEMFYIERATDNPDSLSAFPQCVEMGIKNIEFRENIANIEFVNGRIELLEYHLATGINNSNAAIGITLGNEKDAETEDAVAYMYMLELPAEGELTLTYSAFCYDDRGKSVEKALKCYFKLKHKGES
jgi:hypothetical protein